MGELSAQFDAVGAAARIDESLVPQDGDQLSGGTAPESAPVAAAVEGTEARDPAKPRSGFARQKLRIVRLTNDLEVLQNEYWQLQADHERLQGSHDRLEAEYRQIEAAFAEITQLNAALSAELRQVKQHRPATTFGSPGLGSLMGMR
jgi:hypothetical protein